MSICPPALRNWMRQAPGIARPGAGPEPGTATRPWLSTLVAQARRASSACERTRARADLRLSAAELGAAFLGGTTLASLAAAGRVEELRPGALARRSLAFRGEREPFHPSGPAFPAY
jgi:hypothetical protein